MAVKTAARAKKTTTPPSRTLPDTYFELVRTFPLIHIGDDAHLEEAMALIDRLSAEDLDKGGEAYLDVLSDLVETYGDAHFPIPDASESDVLRELMGSNRITQPQ